jgi:hypothetical protein
MLQVVDSTLGFTAKHLAWYAFLASLSLSCTAICAFAVVDNVKSPSANKAVLIRFSFMSFLLFACERLRRCQNGGNVLVNIRPLRQATTALRSQANSREMRECDITGERYEA